MNLFYFLHCNFSCFCDQESEISRIVCVCLIIGKQLLLSQPRQTVLQSIISLTSSFTVCHILDQQFYNRSYHLPAVLQSVISYTSSLRVCYILNQQFYSNLYCQFYKLPYPLAVVLQRYIFLTSSFTFCHILNPKFYSLP